MDILRKWIQGQEVINPCASAYPFSSFFSPLAHVLHDGGGPTPSAITLMRENRRQREREGLFQPHLKQLYYLVGLCCEGGEAGGEEGGEEVCLFPWVNQAHD